MSSTKTTAKGITDAEMVSAQLTLIVDDPQGEFTSFPPRPDEPDGSDAVRRLLTATLMDLDTAQASEGPPGGISARLTYRDQSELLVYHDRHGDLHLGARAAAAPDLDQNDETQWNLIDAKSPEATTLIRLLKNTASLMQDEAQQGTVIRFETSIGIRTDPTAQHGHNPQDYQVSVEKNGRTLPEATLHSPNVPNRHQTWSNDAGMGPGTRDLKVALHLFIPNGFAVSGSTFHSRFHEYRIALQRLDQAGNILWKTTFPFDLGRHETVGQ